MDTFLHPEQHVVIPEDTGRVDQVRRRLDELRVQKRRIKSLHKSRSSLLRYMRDIEPDICEVLEVQHSTQAEDLSDSDDSGSDAEAPEAHVPLASDSPQVREQLDKCSRYESEIRSMRAELDAMRVQHRQGMRHHATDSSHNEMQRMTARLHAVAHSTILAALHTGPISSSAETSTNNPRTGATMIKTLISDLSDMMGKKKRSISSLIEHTLDDITDVNSKLKVLRKKAAKDSNQRKYFKMLGKFFNRIQTSLFEAQTNVTSFSQLESNFAVGLMAITGIALNVKTAVRERLKEIIKMLQGLIGKIEPIAAGHLWENAPEIELVAALVAEIEATDCVTNEWIIDMSKFEQMLQDQSPMSDLRMRYPVLKHTDVTALMLMDPKRNELHACFQRLVGIDWNMSRRLSGQKVTYASDYNRMANQYRTTTFAFKKARVLEDDVFGVKLVL
jgi:hypothetical protein